MILVQGLKLVECQVWQATSRMRSLVVPLSIYELSKGSISSVIDSHQYHLSLKASSLKQYEVLDQMRWENLRQLHQYQLLLYLIIYIYNCLYNILDDYIIIMFINDLNIL